MDITTDEIVAVWPKLDDDTKRRVYVAVLEKRIVDMHGLIDLQDSQIKALRHEIEVLEEAVKMPQGFARTNHSTENEREFIDAQLGRTVINEV